MEQEGKIQKGGSDMEVRAMFCFYDASQQKKFEEGRTLHACLEPASRAPGLERVSDEQRAADLGTQSWRTAP